MNCVGNNDESKRLRQQLIQQIEQVFADTVYPGDDKLVDRIHYGGMCDECNELAAAFQGKHWTTLTDVKFLREYVAGLSLLEAEAFRFYLPAYMRAALVDPYGADTILDSIAFHLTPPEVRLTYQALPTERLEREQGHFKNRVGGFTSEQAATIKAYLVLDALLYPFEAQLHAQDEIIAFWEKYPSGLE